MKDFGVSSTGVTHKSRITALCFVFFVCLVLTSQTVLAERSLTVRMKICDYDSALVNVSLGALLSGLVEQPRAPSVPLFLRGESASESTEEPPLYRLMDEHSTMSGLLSVLAFKRMESFLQPKTLDCQTCAFPITFISKIIIIIIRLKKMKKATHTEGKRRT